jgi:hypothetical protein
MGPASYPALPPFPPLSIRYTQPRIDYLDFPASQRLESIEQKRGEVTNYVFRFFFSERN